MKKKYTQENWEYVGGDNYSVEINIGESTATLSRLEKNTDTICYERSEMEANAKLIAASKDLLEALEELMLIVKIHSKGTDNNFAWAEMDFAQKAIKKAKGE